LSRIGRGGGEVLNCTAGRLGCDTNWIQLQRNKKEEKRGQSGTKISKEVPNYEKPTIKSGEKKYSAPGCWV